MPPKEYGAWVIFTGQLSPGTYQQEHILSLNDDMLPYHDEDMLPYHDGGLGALLIYS